MKPECVPSKYLFPSATASGSIESALDPHDVSSNNEENLMPNYVAETSPERMDHAARLLTATRLHLNSPPGSPTNWGQVGLNLNDYHYDRIEIGSTFWMPDIAHWWG